MTGKSKVAVALSGGVDSSVAAALALEAGHEVIGVTLRLKHPDPEFSASQTCASKEDMAAVQQICAKLGIEHRVLDEYPAFEERILRPAAAEYAKGRTPNPCCDCNLKVKFGLLIDFARREGCAKLLTGHYARIEETNGLYHLLRGDDRQKDQSYFLWRLRQEELAMIDFPVGKLAKDAVRAIAARYGFVTSDKPDSQDACFQVPGECFGETLRRLAGLPPLPGRFLYRGKVVGRHPGIHLYTVGQRKGLGVALGIPGYVRAIDPETGDIELETDPEKLIAASFSVSELNWQFGDTHPDEVQIRYRSKPVPCRIEGPRVFPETPLRAVTPGQSAVFYRGNLLLGGGVIDHAD